MPKYGTIDKNGKLSISRNREEGYKPLQYEKAPDFNQLTEYVEESQAIDMGDHIYVKVEIKEVDISEDDEFGEDYMAESH